jgi:hypothetical protein
VTARVEIQPTALSLEPGGVSVRYNIATISEGKGTVDVIARGQETTVPLPAPLQQDLEELLRSVGIHMGRLVGLGHESALEKAAADGQPLTDIPAEEEEL